MPTLLSNFTNIHCLGINSDETLASLEPMLLHVRRKVNHYTTYQKKAILQWCSWYLSSYWKTNQDASKQCVSAGLAQGTRQHISSPILQVFKDAQEQFCNCTFSRWWHIWSISVALILWWCPTTNPIWLDKNSLSAEIFMSWLAQETSVDLQSLTRNKKQKEMKWINSPSKK